MRVSVAEMSGRTSSVAALLAMMVVTMTVLITQTHCFSIHQTIAVSYSAGCDGLNDGLPCFVGQNDLDSDEFMLDSEFSRRILAEFTFSQKALNPGALSCNRSKHPNCNPPRNSNVVSEHCKEITNRECWRTN